MSKKEQQKTNCDTQDQNENDQTATTTTNKVFCDTHQKQSETTNSQAQQTPKDQEHNEALQTPQDVIAEDIQIINDLYYIINDENLPAQLSEERMNCFKNQDTQGKIGFIKTYIPVQLWDYFDEITNTNITRKTFIEKNPLHPDVAINGLQEIKTALNNSISAIIQNIEDYTLLYNQKKPTDGDPKKYYNHMSTQTDETLTKKPRRKENDLNSESDNERVTNDNRGEISLENIPISPIQPNTNPQQEQENVQQNKSTELTIDLSPKNKSSKAIKPVTKEKIKNDQEIKQKENKSGEKAESLSPNSTQTTVSSATIEIKRLKTSQQPNQKYKHKQKKNQEEAKEPEKRATSITKTSSIIAPRIKTFAQKMKELDEQCKEPRKRKKDLETDSIHTENKKQKRDKKEYKSETNKEPQKQKKSSTEIEELFPIRRCLTNEECKYIENPDCKNISRHFKKWHKEEKRYSKVFYVNKERLDTLQKEFKLWKLEKEKSWRQKPTNSEPGESTDYTSEEDNTEENEQIKEKLRENETKDRKAKTNKPNIDEPKTNKSATETSKTCKPTHSKTIEDKSTKDVSKTEKIKTTNKPQENLNEGNNKKEVAKSKEKDFKKTKQTDQKMDRSIDIDPHADITFSQSTKETNSQNTETEKESDTEEEEDEFTTPRSDFQSTPCRTTDEEDNSMDRTW